MVFIKKPHNSMRMPILPGTCVTVSGTSSGTATHATSTIISEKVKHKYTNISNSEDNL